MTWGNAFSYETTYGDSNEIGAPGQHPEDEEFKRDLRQTLEKSMKWYLQRVDRAVKGNKHVKRSKGSVSLSRKS